MSPNFFIKRPRFAVVISIVITLIGMLAILAMPVDQYPDIASPKIVVRANFPGASADAVKEAVAGPIEDQVNGAEGMVYMSSKSASDGSYVLTVTFALGTDADLAQVDVQNRVALAEPTLPAEVKKRGIVVRKRSPDMLMVVNLYSPDGSRNGLFLSNYASINIAAELARLEGVGEASIIGPLDYGMRIWLNPERMRNLNVSEQQVVAAINEQNVQAAVGQLGAGPTESDTQFQYVLTTKGRLNSVEEFENIVLRADESGSLITLADVARVELGSQVYKGYGELNNAPGVLLAIYKLSDANSLGVAESVIAKMDELKVFFPEGVDYLVGHDTTLFIKASLEETVITLMFTIGLVVLVTYIFLGSVRATVIPTLAIPVSIIGTLAVLYGVGMTINTVTLFSLILAIGIVVDNAIIVVENVERLMHDEKLPPVEATKKAMSEVSASIIGTSLVLVAVFVPTMMLPGMTGRMFSQFGTTLVVAVLISTINAMTLSPALAAMILKPPTGKPNVVVRGFNAGFAKITEGYTRLVSWLAGHVLVSVLIIAGFLGLLYVGSAMTPSSFVPQEDQGYFLVDVQLPPAASLNRTEVAMDEIIETLMEDPDVENVLSVNGYSILNTALQSNTGMIIAKLTPWEERPGPEQHQLALQQKYQALFNTMPEVSVVVFGAPSIPGLGAIAGFSFVLEDTGGRGAQQLSVTLQSLINAAIERPEITTAFSSFRPGSPQIRLDVDRTRAKTLGVKVDDIFAVLQINLGGFYVNDFNLFGKTYKVLVQADGPYRQQEGDLGRLFVTNNQGDQVPLSALVRAEPSQGADVLYRYNSYDSATINGIPNEAAGYSSGDAMDAMEEVALATLPPGYKFEWTDSSFEERSTGNLAPMAFALSMVFTFLFLAALYESFLTPFAIILTVPLAILGAFAGLLVAGEPLSLYGQIALVLLVGLASKTAILIVEFAKIIRERDKLGIVEATVEAARLRFRPVMMTAISFVVGVFPLVIASGAGAGSRVSLGVAVFGGTLVLATLGTLLMPIFFSLFQRLREVVHRGPTPPVK